MEAKWAYKNIWNFLARFAHKQPDMHAYKRFCKVLLGICPVVLYH